MITTLVTNFLNTVGGNVTSFVTGVFASIGGLLSDRRLKSDVVAVSWSR